MLSIAYFLYGWIADLLRLVLSGLTADGWRPIFIILEEQEWSSTMVCELEVYQASTKKDTISTVCDL